MSWTSFCQDSTKTIKVSTLKKIKKEFDKCDSLKVAYSSKTKEINSLIQTNLLMFNDLESQRKKRLELQVKIDDINKEMIKTSKRKQAPLIYGVGGASLGFLGCLILLK